MFNSKPVSVSKYDPTGPVRIIANKSVANLRINPKKLSVANSQDRIRRVIVATSHDVQRDFESHREK